MSTEETKVSAGVEVIALIAVAVTLVYIVIRIFSDSVLHFAVEHDLGWMADVALICRAEADNADDAGEFPLIKAAKKGSLGCLKSLNPCVYGDKANKNFRLHHANIKDRGKSGIHMLLSAEMFASWSRADIDKKDADGNTALHWAAKGGHYDCVKYLLENGADTETLNNERRTPKDKAEANGYHRCRLLSKKIPITGRDREIDISRIRSRNWSICLLFITRINQIIYFRFRSPISNDLVGRSERADYCVINSDQPGKYFTRLCSQYLQEDRVIFA